MKINERNYYSLVIDSLFVRLSIATCLSIEFFQHISNRVNCNHYSRVCIIFGIGEINNSVRRWIMRAEGRWFRDTCTCHVFTTLDFTRKRPSFTRECLVRREIPVRMQRREMENVTQPAASPLAEVGKNLPMSLNSFLPRSILVWDRFLSSFVKIGKIYLLVG